MISLFAKAFKLMAIYILGASGDILIEKGGHLNMGVPGIMFFGAYGGLLGLSIYGGAVPAGIPLNPGWIIFISCMSAMLFGAIGGLIYCFLTVTLKCNQNVVGLALTTFGVGLSRFCIYMLPKSSLDRMQSAGLAIQNLFPANFVNSNPFNQLFLSGSFFTYLSIIIAIIMAIILVKTRTGLNLRAVGENPASADAAGINVNKYKYLSTIIGSMIVALAGITLELDYLQGAYNPQDTVDAYGWLCLSIVILSAWRSWLTIPIGMFIAITDVVLLGLIPSSMIDVKAIMGATPYVASIIILIISSAVGSKKMQPPAGLGKTYFREDR